MGLLFTILSYGLLLIVAIINITGSYLFYSTPSTPKYSYLGSDFPEDFDMGPNWKPVRMTVEDSTHYQPLLPYASQEWLSMIPEGEGFVRYSAGEHDRAFGLSIYHQLHCMNQIRRATYRPPSSIEHLHHCVNYIRQLTLCKPNLHLEPVVLKSGEEMEGMVGVDGLGVTHTCRDWSALFEAVEDHHAAWMKSKEP